MGPRLLWLPLLFGIVSSACGRSEGYSHVRNLDSRGERVICFGDSLTEGVGAGAGQDYPSLLAQQLRYPVINAGRRGDTSADGLARLERDVLGLNPRLVIVLFGGNDFLRQVSLTETRKNLEGMVRKIQSHGAMVVLVGVRLGLFTDEYGPIYREIAQRYGALLIPEILKGILSDPKLKSDSIHPNSAGYSLMAERIIERIQPLLEEADRRRGQTNPMVSRSVGSDRDVVDHLSGLIDRVMHRIPYNRHDRGHGAAHTHGHRHQSGQKTTAQVSCEQHRECGLNYLHEQLL